MGFQGHHGAPWTITHRSTMNNVHKIARMAGPLALVAGALMKPFAAIATSVLLWGQVCAQEAHRWSHVPPSSQPSFVRRLQDLMWNEATTSVFDLEAAELAAEQKGEQMPWHNDSYDGKLPDGFTADQAVQYIKKVGGG